MSVLPSQKLTIGELYVSMAVGLILFLMPNDMKNQFGTSAISIVLVGVMSFAIVGILYLAIKRYEAVGAAMFTQSIITVLSFAFSIVNNVLSGTNDYWPTISDYQLINMFVLWTVPFMLMVIIRMFTVGKYDTGNNRLRFARFLSLSLRALMIIYILVVVFKQIMPHRPDMINARSIYYMPITKIKDCIYGNNGGSIAYIVWHCLILAPFTFSLLILNSKLRWYNILIINLATGLTIEILQFSLNTGIVYTDDFIMYTFSGFVGMILKLLIDKIRYCVTKGEEKNMMSLDYTPIVKSRYSNEEDEEITDNNSAEELTVEEISE